MRLIGAALPSRSGFRRRAARAAPGATLARQPVGAVLRLLGVDDTGDGDARTTSMQLLALGLRTGQTVTVTNVRGDAVVVAVDAGRVAIGPELATRIRVEPVLDDVTGGVTS